MLGKVGLEHSSKSTKYELEDSHSDPVHEQFSFLKTAKLSRECNEVCLQKTKIKKNMYKFNKLYKSYQKNAHEPGRRKSPRAHTL